MFSNIEQAEYMDTYMTEVLDWENFMADMETNPYDD